ncbi:mRNA capping large subunit family protein [Cryptosporidium andersoni]|uniref:mRNA (guanine-N(7))-methyltransferase n=1 Tax=Cryptosporidium andersoni TaxID=117008 RepID=A0A1J4MSW7_9CRYT|nr:mRNA capping large subunit family protein [Cryptosporidium andersoni]
MSQNSAKLHFISLAKRASIIDIIRDFIVQCSEHPNSDIYASFGELSGVFSGLSIHLPVAGECILEQGSSDYKFIDKISWKQQSFLVERILKANRTSWEVESLPLSVLVEEYYNNEIVVVSDNECNKKDTFYELNLGDIIIYRPKSLVHYRISGVSRTATDTKPKEFNLLSKHEKNIVGWKFYRKIGRNYPFWEIKIVHVTQNNKELKDLDNDKSITKDKEDDDEDIQKSEYWMVLLVGCKDIILKHVDLYKKGMNNGLYRIATEFVLNSRIIANYLEECLTLSISQTPRFISYYYPNFFGDITSSVKAHYNTKKIKQADHSIIQGLRKYNNEVKRALIDLFIDGPLKVKNSGYYILDLACGHGQDILKYKGKKIKKLIGIDISAEEIAEARHRLKGYQHSICFPIEFHVGNLLSKSTYTNILKNYKFDVVTIQLALHYMLINEEISREFLNNVVRYLNPGGLFIGTTISCDEVYNSIKYGSEKVESIKLENEIDKSEYEDPPRSDLKYISGNSIYSITINSEMWDLIFKDEKDNYGLTYFRNTWGLKYDFWLIEHINQYEYVVPWDAFCNLAKEVGLELLYTSNFPQFTKYVCNHYPNLRISNWIKNPKNANILTQHENDVFSLYRTFVFKKAITSEEVPDEKYVHSLSSGYKIRRKNI